MGIEINNESIKPIKEYKNSKTILKSLISICWNVWSIKPNSFKEIDNSNHTNYDFRKWGIRHNKIQLYTNTLMKKKDRDNWGEFY